MCGPFPGRASPILSERSATVSDERLLVAVADTEFFCTTCDGAVFVLDGVGAAALVTRLAS